MNRSRLNGNKTHNKLYLKKSSKEKKCRYPVNYSYSQILIIWWVYMLLL